METSPPSFFFGKIHLYPDIKPHNYLCSMIHYIVMTFTFVSVDILQPMLFRSKDYFNISENDGSTNGNILLIDIIIKIIFAPIYGILTDVIGRKPILFFGYASISVATCLLSFPNDIYPGYCLIRMFYAQGTMAIATSPLLADYVADYHKGRASAINVIMASIGAVISAYVIQNLLTNNMSLRITSIVIGICIFTVGCLYTVGIKGGNYYKIKKKIYCDKKINENNRNYCSTANNNVNNNNEKEGKNQILDGLKENEFLLKNYKEKRGIKEMLLVGFKAAKNKWILLGYVTAFLARANSIIITLFLVLWVKSFYPSNEKDIDDKANIEANTFAGVIYTVVFIFAIVYGVLIEKINGFCIMGISLISTIIGISLFGACSSNKDILVWITMAIMGVGMAGLDTLNLYLINKYADPIDRGKINGMAALWGVVGILIISVLGGTP